MNTVWIVLPILTLLMFELGLTINLDDFKAFRTRPRPVIAGIVGQILFLPLIAFIICLIFEVEPVFFMGIMIIACSPGGSSSNVFSMLAKGDVALSVSLTALSSIITLFTIPVILDFSAVYIGNFPGHEIKLPVGNLVVQNLLMMLVPIVIGITMKRFFPTVAGKIHKILSKIAFPALILLAAIFFVQHRETIVAEFGKLGFCITVLILSAMGGGVLLSRVLHLTPKENRTLVIEIGMQNAAQAIAVASSPFVFNNGTMAIPAIIYALMMNVILLTYIPYPGKSIETKARTAQIRNSRKVVNWLRSFRRHGHKVDVDEGNRMHTGTIIPMPRLPYPVSYTEYRRKFLPRPVDGKGRNRKGLPYPPPIYRSGIRS